MPRHPRLATLLALAFALAAGCGADDRVSRDLGGACANEEDCSSLCLPHERWPNGFCTRLCAGDGDCGDGAVCVETSSDGAVCLFACAEAADCAFLSGAGATWSCIEFAGGDAGGERACGAE